MDRAGAVNQRVMGLHEHRLRRREKDSRRGSGVGLEKPDGRWQVVDSALVSDGDGALGLEKERGAAIVVNEVGNLRMKRREGVNKGDEVLADQPLGVLGVRKSGGAALGERGGEELLRVLRPLGRWHGWRRGRWRCHHRRIELEMEMLIAGED